MLYAAAATRSLTRAPSPRRRAARALSASRHSRRHPYAAKAPRGTPPRYRFPELRRLHRVLPSTGHARRRDVVGQGQARFEAVISQTRFGEQFVLVELRLLVIPKIVVLVVLLLRFSFKIVGVVVGRGLRLLP